MHKCDCGCKFLDYIGALTSNNFILYCMAQNFGGKTGEFVYCQLPFRHKDC